jgi:hypothetical protein
MQPVNQPVPASPPAGPSGSRRRGRRLLFKLAITCLALLLVEFCCEVICRVRYGSQAELQERRHNIATASSLTQGVSDDVELPVVIHPYQGVVTRPTSESDRAAAPPGQFVGTFGFRGIDSPILTRSNDQLIVAVVGGSVARQFVDNASEALKHQLATHSKHREREITILPLAVDGYKQPQQLTMLAYLMTLGAEFDIVINLDGLNEVALPAMDNVPMGVFSAFPRQWGTVITTAESVEVKRRIGYTTYLRLAARDSARFFDRWLVKHSRIGLVLWKILDDRRSLKLQQEQHRIADLLGSKVEYAASGPPETFADAEAAYVRSADIWSRASFQLHGLCSANDTHYFHFLQPNQYVNGSKPMSAEELARSISDESPFRDPVRHAYPLLMQKGAELKQRGVKFTDLTQAFSQTAEPVYIDDCCHLNGDGTEILAQEISRTILDELRRLDSGESQTD